MRNRAPISMTHASSALDTLPNELKLMIYSFIDPRDLLSMGLVSAFWRMVVLADKRWEKWLSMLHDPVSGASISTFMKAHGLPVNPRILVCLGLHIFCVGCGRSTDGIFLPTLQRVCPDCLSDDEYDVAAISSALTTYDVRPKEALDAGLVSIEYIKNSSGPVKLVSVAQVKAIAIAKHTSAAALDTHLANRKARALTSYIARVAAYNAAAPTQKPAKSRPQKPAVLRELLTPATYTAYCTVSMNYLERSGSGSVDTLVAKDFKACRICHIVDCALDDPGMGTEELNELLPVSGSAVMTETALAVHKLTAHYANEDDPCCRKVGEDSCEPCMNRWALGIEEDLLLEEMRARHGR
ncbi:hypothetical protein MKEN_00962700 [Mycena kentingensis (nom. inval.)]|nr:hypothetical protein MKEN_00962700 [Mycena kentingensis (nom. inval.)]